MDQLLIQLSLILFSFWVYLLHSIIIIIIILIWDDSQQASADDLPMES